MSKSFLKVSEAYTKLGLSGGGSNWIRKSELVATGKCDTTKLEKYGNNDFVVDDDIVLINNGYYIPFTGSFEDSLGNLPIQRFAVISSGTTADFGENGYLIYDIGDLLKDKDKITIELDYMFLTYTQQYVIIPVFTTDKTIFPHKLPMTIWCEYCTWNNMDYNVVYSCGIPEDISSVNNAPYVRMVINKWYHSKIVWVYSEQRGYYYLNNKVMSVRWPSTTRSYNIRPTKLYFGMINDPIYNDGLTIHSKTNIKIKNFKMTFE